MSREVFAMGGTGVKIGRILGIPIYIHTSWFLIFGLITYSLGSEFAAQHSNWTQQQIWSLALIDSALFFGSVVFHELSHSVVAMHYRIPVASITLFFFGGVARITREPDTAGQEFQIAFAGPLSSYFLAGAFYLVWRATPQPHDSMLAVLASSLAYVNFILATFNLLLPGFPLDGGRILRSIVWGITKDYARSTRIAARGGQAVAYAMMGGGLAMAIWPGYFGGDILNGLWFVFIGWFLLSAARQSYAQVSAHGVLEGLKVADIMSLELPTTPRDISLEEYAREVARTGHRTHLVVTEGQLVGLMSVRDLQSVPREEWSMMSVQAVMKPRDQMQWAAPEESALDLLERMRRSNAEQMAVIHGGNIIGMVTRDSIMRVVQTRNDLAHLTKHDPARELGEKA
jgi:Zn-dependent protease/predicted transcriptional regulator